MARVVLKGRSISIRLPIDLEELLSELIPQYGGTITSTIVALVRLGMEKHYELLKKKGE